MLTLGVAAAVLVLLLSGGPAWAAPVGSSGDSLAEDGDPVCLLAVIDGTHIDDSDADALRALLQPPPGRDEARRLAVDAALAHFWLRGYVAPASARGRLEAWRSFMAAPRPDTGDEADEVAIVQASLHHLAAMSGLVAGPCLRAAPAVPAVAEAARASTSSRVPDPRSASALLLRRAGIREPLVSARLNIHDTSSQGCLPRDTGAPPRVVDLGLVPLSHLDRDVARVAATLPAGATSAPLLTRFGLVSVSVLERIERRTHQDAGLRHRDDASPIAPPSAPRRCARDATSTPGDIGPAKSAWPVTVSRAAFTRNSPRTSAAAARTPGPDGAGSRLRARATKIPEATRELPR